MDNGPIVAFNAATIMTSSGVTKMAGDGSLMGAAVPPQPVVRGLPGWLTQLMQSAALVLILLGLAFASLPLYLCLPLALLVLAAIACKSHARCALATPSMRCGSRLPLYPRHTMSAAACLSSSNWRSLESHLVHQADCHVPS